MSISQECKFLEHTDPASWTWTSTLKMHNLSFQDLWGECITLPFGYYFSCSGKKAFIKRISSISCQAGQIWSRETLEVIGGHFFFFPSKRPLSLGEDALGFGYSCWMAALWSCSCRRTGVCLKTWNCLNSIPHSPRSAPFFSSAPSVFPFCLRKPSVFPSLKLCLSILHTCCFSKCYPLSTSYLYVALCRHL